MERHAEKDEASQPKEASPGGNNPPPSSPSSSERPQWADEGRNGDGEGGRSDRSDAEVGGDGGTEDDGRLSTDDDDGDDDDEGSSSSPRGAAAKGSSSARSAADCRQKAMALKEEGNAHLKEGVFDLAIGKYKKGLRKAKRVAEESEEDAALLRALHLNLAMAYLKNEQLFDATKAASEVLAKDPSNVKALFRRGQARCRMGLLEQARDDFAAVLRLDATNGEASRELLRVRKKLKEDLEERKKAYSNIFEKTAGLYDDRERQMERKRQEEEEARKKRRQEWHSEMNERQARGENEVSFDEWEKQKEKEMEEKKKKGNEKAAPPADSAVSPSPSESSTTTATTSASSKSRPKRTEQSDGEESDEECRRIISETKRMGYCYFRKDLTDEERRLKEENTPQRIEGQSGGVEKTTKVSTASSSLSSSSSSSGTSSSTRVTPTASSSSAPSPSQLAGQSLSSWNSSGATYEEKDMTAWAVEHFRAELEKATARYGADDPLDPTSGGEELQQLLQSLSSSLRALETGSSNDEQQKVLDRMAKFSFGAEMKVKKISGVEGEAHVAVVRGTRRFIFELDAVLSFSCEVRRNERLSAMPWPGSETSEKEDAKVYEGDLRLHDVSSAAAASPSDFLNDSKVVWKKTIDRQHKAVAEDCLKKFKESVIERIQIFFEKYKKAC